MAAGLRAAGAEARRLMIAHIARSGELIATRLRVDGDGRIPA